MKIDPFPEIRRIPIEILFEEDDILQLNKAIAWFMNNLEPLTIGLFELFTSFLKYIFNQSGYQKYGSIISDFHKWFFNHPFPIIKRQKLEYFQLISQVFREINLNPALIKEINYYIQILEIYQRISVMALKLSERNKKNIEDMKVLIEQIMPSMKNDFDLINYYAHCFLAENNNEKAIPYIEKGLKIALPHEKMKAIYNALSFWASNNNNARILEILNEHQDFILKVIIPFTEIEQNKHPNLLRELLFDIKKKKGIHLPELYY